MGGTDPNSAIAMPPLGVQSNFDNPPNEIATAYTALAVALITVTLFAWCRFLVKLCIVEKVHAEDYLIPFAWLAAVGHIACGFLIAQFAPIIHSWDMSWYTFGRYLLWYRLGSIFYNAAILLIKIAMLIQVLRIFVPRGSLSKTYYITHGLIWANGTYYIVTIFLMVFNCRPLSKAWKPWTEGKCLDMGTITMVTAIVNLLGDLAIMFLTQKIIWGLMRVDPRQRIKLAVVFCAGFIPCIFAGICLHYNGKQMKFTDFIHDAAFMTIACYGEISSGMFVLFLPIVPRFFTHIKEGTTFSTLKHRSSHRRTPSALEFSDIGAGKDSVASKIDPLKSIRKQSVFHISYTQRGSEDRLPIVRSPTRTAHDDKEYN